MAVDRDRIAVVLIHGMGEPRPMATLRSLVAAISGAVDQPARSWSKPLDYAELYDIRRIVMEGSKTTRPIVDYYEFYWAHLLQGSTLPQLIRWLWALFWRPLRTVPEQLKPVYVLGKGLALLIAVTIGLVVLWLFLHRTLSPSWAAGTAVASFIYGLASYWLLGTLTDVARYLDTLPDNVGARFAIQKAGVDLIVRLHDEKRYDRIVVVGHSLGSMIGYDIMRLAWLRFATKFAPNMDRHNDALTALSDAVKNWSSKSPTIDEFRALQTAAWREHLGNGGGWRVTDYITLGSSLADAVLLMTDGPDDFARRINGRELCTCPPTWDTDFGITRPIYVVPPDSEFRAPDHAGAFAYTRWTNLYGAAGYGLDGDPLSGPLAPVFGHGIRDLAVGNPTGKWFALHTNYWTPRPSAAREDDPLPTLLRSMELVGRHDPDRTAPGAARPPV